ncbi:MAG TPA: DUF885 family protein [Acidobacteriota bacterium]|nr:DUF885 family protein [Acidobacteriota bacterium]
MLKWMAKATIAIAMLLSFARLPGATVSAAIPQDMEHPAELVILAQEYRAWGAEPHSGTPDYVALDRERVEGLADFKARLAAIDPSAWSVHDRIDYLVLQIEMDHQDFQLRVIRQPTRNPDFYVNQAIGGVTRYIGGRYVDGDGVQVPYDDQRTDGIVAAMRRTPEIVDRAREGLIEGVPEMADVAIERLEDIGSKYRQLVEILTPRVPDSHTSALAEAADVAATSLGGYRDWLLEARDDMTAPYAIGAPAFEWLVQNVYVYPYDNEQLLQQAESERLRNWAFLQFERQNNKDLPRPGGVASDPPSRKANSNAEYTEWNDATDVLSRLWAEEIEFFTRPDYIGPMRHGENLGYYIDPFGFMSFPVEDRPEDFEREFLVEPDSWYTDIYWNLGHRIDPGTNHPHSHYMGHNFEGIVTDHLTCKIRRPHNTRGDAWANYIEEVQLQTKFPFVRGDLIRELMHGLSIMRAERVHIAVKFADGSMSPEEVVTYMMETTPWMEPYVARKHELWRKYTRPAQVLTYQVGKFEIFKLMRVRMRQLGDDFDFRTFHDDLLATGRIPLALARWEMAGLDDDVAHLWDRAPIPEEATRTRSNR